MENNDRIRTVNIDKISEEDFSQVAEKLGEEVSITLKNTFEECNKLLNVYGLEIVYNYELRSKKVQKTEE